VAAERPSGIDRRTAGDARAWVGGVADDESAAAYRRAAGIGILAVEREGSTPNLTSEPPPNDASVMTPLTVVDRLLLPTMSVLLPRK
jgi:hypothetical protein